LLPFCYQKVAKIKEIFGKNYCLKNSKTVVGTGFSAIIKEGHGRLNRVPAPPPQNTER